MDSQMKCAYCKFVCIPGNKEPCSSCLDHYHDWGYQPNFQPLKHSRVVFKQKESVCDKSKRTAILTEANNIVSGNRKAGEYGQPEDSFGVIAGLWSEYLDQKIKPHDVAVMMALLKIARIKGGEYKLDNWIDLAGYAACGGECQGKEEGE